MINNQTPVKKLNLLDNTVYVDETVLSVQITKGENTLCVVTQNFDINKQNLDAVAKGFDIQHYSYEVLSGLLIIKED